MQIISGLFKLVAYKIVMQLDTTISPYTIFADANPRTPDMQAKTGQPIHFWNCLLKVVVLQKTESS